MTENKKKWSATADRILHRASKVLQVGDAAADVLAHMAHGVTAPGMVAVGLKVVNGVRRHRERDHWDYFGDGWRALDTWGYQNTLFHAIALRSKPEPPVGVSDNSSVLLTTHDGVTFGWRKYGEDEEIEGPWIDKAEDDQRALHVLGRTAWDYLHSSRAVIAVERNRQDRITIGFKPDLTAELLASDVADKLVERMQGFLEQGHHRSILLVGEPGTGKTCIMHYMASRVGGFSLRVATSDLHGLSLREIQGAVDLLRPDVVLIDDFDRYQPGGYRGRGDETGQAAFLLDAVEHINQASKVLICSANYSDDFPEALLRPGRFDEIQIVDRLEPAIVDGMIGDGVPIKIRKRLYGMPIAFVAEFAKRKATLGAEQAYAELKDLSERAEMVERGRRRHRRRKKRKDAKTQTPAQKAVKYRREAARLETRSAALADRALRKRGQAERQEKAAEAQAAKKAPQKRTAKSRRT